jgi:type IV pilus assembly protein PilY1
MFLPDRGPRWAGNLKKLKLKNDIQVDRTGAVAIDSSGNIAADAKTFWSTSNTPDGNEVTLGGAGEQLSSSNANRKVYSDLGTNGALVNLTKANAVSYFGGDTALAAYMNVQEEELQSHIDWALGFDVDDENKNNLTTDKRHDLFADPLHSKPLVLNFGGNSNNQDVRIILGTNAGVLHMFDDDGESVAESWALMPNEFFPNIKPLRENFANTPKIYGIDGSPSAYLLDSDGDGTISAANGDKAWIFVGLRRGGNSYYALDITNPDSPSLKWRIDANNVGFSRLGQSWSRPKVINIRDVNSGILKPALVFGGGYSINKDSKVVGTPDNSGNAIYIVDADTGALIWSASPDNTTSKNTQVIAMADSIPASIAALDSDGDGITDRLYAADTGGNVWRVDMPGQDPFAQAAPWSVIQFASLGGETVSTDRRFFSEPAIARSYTSKTTTTTELDQDGNPIIDEQGNQRISYQYEEIPFEAVLIGSGNRVYPTDTHVDNKLFMLRDEAIITQSFTTQSLPEILTINDLVDYSADPYGGALSDQDKAELDLVVSNSKGWFVDLNASGEKSLSSATVVAGVAYYTSFTPSELSTDTSSCTLESGGGLLYALDLHLGTNIYNWRTIDIGDKVPDTPTVVIPESSDPNEPNKLLFVGVGDGEGGGTLVLCAAGQNCDPEPCEGENCPPKDVINLETMRTYIYIDEDNN